ncbi:Eukaryotic translation initiation factor 3 subunit G [Frankliniella fusca]|uniref:Eukaryotic translation initiation factor 3 subunit G n=1 Tax=Frankliniella fusca TaxID=407009 RepID=A0AAE1I0R8_9NEOP|nr:Eukaryotic translation initiation factor 3 subunit G [Frankliniella fusca]
MSDRIKQTYFKGSVAGSNMRSQLMSLKRSQMMCWGQKFRGRCVYRSQQTSLKRSWKEFSNGEEDIKEPSKKLTSWKQQYVASEEVSEKFTSRKQQYVASEKESSMSRSRQAYPTVASSSQ